MSGFPVKTGIRAPSRPGQEVRTPTKLEEQRDAIVGNVIRYGTGFGWSEKPCHACSSTLTAKAADGRWACPWHFPIVQLELEA